MIVWWAGVVGGVGVLFGDAEVVTTYYLPTYYLPGRWVDLV